MHYALQYVKDLFSGLFTFFDRIFIDTGYIVWVGSAFLMVITYRFLIKPVFGGFSIGSFGSDDNKTFRSVSERRLGSPYVHQLPPSAYDRSKVDYYNKRL